MRILGIDPGFATIGFAVLDVKAGQKTLIDVGVIRTAPELPFPTRLNEIYKDMNELIKEYKPSHSSVEQIFFSKNVSTGINVAEARGVILLCLEQAAIRLHEYSPSAMKLALTGDGKADKYAIQKMVMLELNLKEVPKPDDAADALSLALTLAAELR